MRSPDGNEIAFHSQRNGNRDIFVVSADGGEPYQLTADPAQDRYPSWPPDGREIVFQRATVDASSILVLSRQGGELRGERPRRLASSGARYYRGARWSPRGDAVAFNDEAVLLVPASGGELRELSSFGDTPLWSPDGETVYFRNQEGFWSIGASGGEPRPLVRFDDPSRLALRPDWSTAGERFYFALTEFESDVWVMELETTPR